MRPAFVWRLAQHASRLLGSVLKEGMLLVVAGMAIGVPATLAATRLITSLLFGVRAADPLTTECG